MCQYTVATYVSLTKERRIKQTKKEIADIIIMQLLCSWHNIPLNLLLNSNIIIIDELF